MEPQQEEEFFPSLDNPLFTQREIEEEFGAEVVPTVIESELDIEMTQKGHKLLGSWHFENDDESFDINFYNQKPNKVWESVSPEEFPVASTIFDNQWRQETVDEDDLGDDLWWGTNV